MNKAEAKFKRGDRIVWDGEVYNILDVLEMNYNVGGYIVPIARQDDFILLDEQLEIKINDWLEHGNITDTRYDSYDDRDIRQTAAYFYRLGQQDKSQWKPDEKQFEAFGTAKNYTIKFHLDGPDDPIAKILESLYQDLRKLKLASKKSEEDKPFVMDIES